ncbi:hypothetical protein HZS_6571 [Henneguya salminicola]|nr:hypothetical protein HZS_6571 [Henneguya salminicola]
MASICSEADDLEFRNHINIIFKKVDDKKQFRKSIRILRRNILELSNSCVNFVGSLYTHDWNNYDLFESSYMIKLIMEIFSAHPFTIKDGMEGLIKSVHTLSTAPDQTSLLDELSLLISCIISICPLSKIYLLSCLADNLPFYTRPKNYILNFFQFLFSLIKCIPILRIQFYTLIIQGLIKIDTEISLEKLEKNEKFLANFKEKGVSIDVVYKKFSNIDKSSFAWLDISDKYDDLMALCFDHFIQIFQAQDKHDSFYCDLNDAFSKVLACRGLIAVHFIWFYFCGNSKIFFETTLNDIWQKFTNLNEPIHIRHAAATHLGGLISHISNTGSDTVRKYAGLMSRWIHEYIRDKEENVIPQTNGNLLSFKPHHLFYVICQSLFYILISENCLLKVENNSANIFTWVQFLSSLELDNIFLSRLNPLYYCSSIIVEKIAKIGKDHEIFFAYNIITRNKRILNMVQTLQDSNKNIAAVNLLDFESACNFPYSPYILPSTKNLITPIYRY